MFYGSGDPAAGLRSIVLILVAIGLVLGLALIGSDLINPIRSISQYQRDQVETQRQSRQNEIDLEQYEVRAVAEAQAMIQRLSDETAYRWQSYQQELEQARLAAEQARQAARERDALRLHLLRIAAYAAIAVAGLSLLALAIGWAVRIARTQPTSARSVADEWTPERRRQAVALARQREREYRAWVLHQDELTVERRLYDLFQAPDRMYDDPVSQPN